VVKVSACVRVCVVQPQHQTSTSSPDGRSVRRHTTPVTAAARDVTMTSSSSTVDRCAGGAVSAASSPVLVGQLVTGSCRELRSALPVVRSPNKSMERPLGLLLCSPVCDRVQTRTTFGHFPGEPEWYRDGAGNAVQEKLENSGVFSVIRLSLLPPSARTCGQ